MLITRQNGATHPEKAPLILPSARKLIAKADAVLRLRKIHKAISASHSPSRRHRSALTAPPKLKERPGPYPSRFPGSTPLNPLHGPRQPTGKGDSCASWSPLPVSFSITVEELRARAGKEKERPALPDPWVRPAAISCTSLALMDKQDNMHASVSDKGVPRLRSIDRVKAQFLKQPNFRPPMAT
ncbi:hypothetical protein CPB84DRAFT_1788034, partial [Gymnopilus junonius]